MEDYHGKWESFFDLSLSEFNEIINVKTDYTCRFLKFVEKLLDIPISYFYIWVIKEKSKFLMEINLFMTNSELISQTKKYKNECKYGAYEKAVSLLYKNKM